MSKWRFGDSPSGWGRMLEQYKRKELEDLSKSIELFKKFLGDGSGVVITRINEEDRKK